VVWLVMNLQANGVVPKPHFGVMWVMYRTLQETGIFQRNPSGFEFLENV